MLGLHGLTLLYLLSDFVTEIRIVQEFLCLNLGTGGEIFEPGHIGLLFCPLVFILIAYGLCYISLGAAGPWAVVARNIVFMFRLSRCHYIYIYIYISLFDLVAFLSGPSADNACASVVSSLSFCASVVSLFAER